MIKYIVLGIAVMMLASIAGSEIQQTYAQSTTPTMTPTPKTSVPNAAPATGRGM